MQDRRRAQGAERERYGLQTQHDGLDEADAHVDRQSLSLSLGAAAAVSPQTQPDVRRDAQTASGQRERDEDRDLHIRPKRSEIHAKVWPGDEPLARLLDAVVRPQPVDDVLNQRGVHSTTF